jgi:hypothetical protein
MIFMTFRGPQAHWDTYQNPPALRHILGIDWRIPIPLEERGSDPVGSRGSLPKYRRILTNKPGQLEVM